MSCTAAGQLLLAFDRRTASICILSLSIIWMVFVLGSVIYGKGYFSAGSDVDVFICHRGPDTKLNFVSDLLKHELQGRSVYADKWGLQPGEPNWPTLLNNVRKAGIVLVVLSPRFQESAWCLEELCAAIDQGRLDKLTLRVVCFGRSTDKIFESQLAMALVELKGAPQLEEISSMGDAAILQRWRSALQKAKGIVSKQFDESSRSGPLSLSSTKLSL